jgi:ABC-2 type transport system permease protein
MSITAAIIAKDVRELRRDRRVAVMALLVLVLAVTAIATAWARISAHEADRAATIAADRATWEGQGARNPHSAAHFSKWAFKPLTAEAVLDPGIAAYAGSAVWMEAHNRNPAVARPINDQTVILPSGDFSLAWVLQVLMPLLVAVIAASSVARERERGTLRLMLASGVSAAGLTRAKLASVSAVTLLLSGSISLIGALAAAGAGPIDPARLALWLFAYAVFLVVVVAVAVAVSLRARSSGQALMVLAGLWLFAIILTPLAGASVADYAAPAPTSEQFWADVAAAKAAYPDPFEAGMEAFGAKVMAQYGVNRLEDLPVSFGGLQLEEDERLGNQVYDAQFGALFAVYERQRAWVRWASLVSPLPALQNISMALSGTDMPHQIAFQQQAEARRRAVVTQLNTDLIQNGAGKDFDYLARPGLWAEVEDFTFVPPTLGTTLAGLWREALILLGWMAVAVMAALRSAWHLSGSEQ